MKKESSQGTDLHVHAACKIPNVPMAIFTSRHRCHAFDAERPYDVASSATVTRSSAVPFPPAVSEISAQRQQQGSTRHVPISSLRSNVSPSALDSTRHNPTLRVTAGNCRPFIHNCNSICVADTSSAKNVPSIETTFIESRRRSPDQDCAAHTFAHSCATHAPVSDTTDSSEQLSRVETNDNISTR